MPEGRKPYSDRLDPEFDLPRIPSGVDGLDFILVGGLPAQRMTLVSGPAGSGKTILALQMLAAAVENGEGGALFVTFEEQPEQLRQTMRSLEIPVDEWEAAGQWGFLDASDDGVELVESGEFSLDALRARIEAAADRIGATRVCLDSLGAFFTRFERPDNLRRELFKIAVGLRARGITPVITAERPIGQDSEISGFEDFVADTVVALRNSRVEDRRRRTIEVLKVRGAPHRNGEFPMTITASNGIAVIALPQVLLDQPARDVRISSGLTELDAMCNGGYLRDSIVLVSGVTGTGKTLLASTFMKGAAESGERCVLFGFEESRDQLIRNATGWSLPFRDYEEQGLLRIECTYPEWVSLEEHLLRIEAILDEFKPTRIAIDSLSALERSAPHHSFRDFILTLTALLKERQIAAVITSTGSTMINTNQTVAETHISTITDSIILLRYVEMGGSVSRAMTVLKMRGSKHDRDIREFTVSEKGMTVGDPFRDVYGIISGEIKTLPGVDQGRIRAMFDH